MKLLLDTHTFLWFVDSDPELSTRARILIQDPNNDISLSVASLWEISIKASLGKLIDRMLIAQGMSDGLAILSKDPHFTHYPVTVIW